MKLNSASSLLKADAFKTGDVIKVLDAGRITFSEVYKYDDGNPKKNYVFKVLHQGKEAEMNFNKFSRDNLIEALGDDTDTWVGQSLRVEVEFNRSLKVNQVILYVADAAQAGASAQAQAEAVAKTWDDA